MLVWAVHDGGFDDDTWYWGALVSVALLALVLTLRRRWPHSASRARTAACVCFALYIGWSYLSMSWAQAPGVALDGSNRALLYLAVFCVAALLPWTVETALAALLAFAIGVGVIAVVLLVRLGAADNVAGLLSGGRMNVPTGYYNATAALFSIDALICIGLAARRELPGLLRGLLMAFAGAALQIAILGQSRGWLFTLPIVVVLVGIVAADRVRTAGAAILPVVIALIPIRRLLLIYDDAYSSSLNHVAARAGQEGLVLFGVAFVVGTLLAWGDQLAPWRLGRRGRRWVGGAAIAAVIAGGAAGAVVVSHGSPFHFIARQWSGFSHPQQVDTGSHFADVGSGRYDFWRVAIDAFASHPIGGLGQDNFADYYLPRRHTSEEPEWTHSLELRLLAHTGIVGFGLFAGFVVFALIAAVRARRRGPPLTRAVVGIALVALVVWVVYGSVDWFWELPALSGPALGFLGMAVALDPGAQRRRAVAGTGVWQRLPAGVRVGCGAVALLAAVVVLAFPYLSVREVSIADDIQARDPGIALQRFSAAAELNPLSSIPGRLAGALALTHGQNRVALQRFRQSISAEPGGWFAWLGAGLAESALGDRSSARRSYQIAYAINTQQPAVRQALRRVGTEHPLTAAQALRLLIVQ